MRLSSVGGVGGVREPFDEVDEAVDEAVDDEDEDEEEEEEAAAAAAENGAIGVGTGEGVDGTGEPFFELGKRARSSETVTSICGARNRRQQTKRNLVARGRERE